VASVRSLPWVYPVVNAVSGTQEFRLATFVIQAMVVAGIFAALLLLAFVPEKRRKDGDLTLVFLLLYGASQIVLDSTRYDSLFFRSNGFISIVQVVSALATGLACAVFSVRLVRTHGMDKRYIALWAIFAAFVGLGGYMEYHVQRHGDQAVFAYSLMSMALLGMVFVVTVIWVLAQKEPEEKPVSENTQTEAVPAQKQERKPKAKFAQPKQTHWEEEEDLYIPLEELGLPEDFFFEDE
jgi:prolipoprotein diacylglyceryltransferase